MAITSKIIKPLLPVFVTIVIVISLIFVFISPTAKYLIEKYDVKYLGREINLSKAHVNPFSGAINFDDLIIHERNSDSIFISMQQLSVKIAVWKLFSKQISLSELTMEKPNFILRQHKKEFNFDDLIARFTSKKRDTTPSILQVNILNIRLKDGKVFYHENILPVDYFIKHINMESNGLHWNNDTIVTHFEFQSGNGSGQVKGEILTNLKTLTYSYLLSVNNFDLKILKPYLQAIANYGNVAAFIDAEIVSNGNFKDPENLSMKGQIKMHQFHFGKTATEDYGSFDSLVLAVKELNPKEHKYRFDSISLSHPYFKYERYDQLDNIQNMFGKKGVKISEAKANTNQFNLIIEIGNYIKLISQNFFRSNYKIERLAIYQADLRFNDFSTYEKFGLRLAPLYVLADSIDKSHKRVNVKLNSRVYPYGNIAVALSINPKDSSDFDLEYQITQIPISIFNPYLIAYTSYPLDKGSLALSGRWKVRAGNIESKNHLLITDPRLGQRVVNKAANWFPAWLAMAFIRERGNVIDYQIPIKGNLNNPEFQIHDVIADLLKNILIKPPTYPYSIWAKAVETEIEKSIGIKWEIRSSVLKAKQIYFIKQMAHFLTENKGSSIMVQPKIYLEKEEENLSLFEAKKKFFLFQHPKLSQVLSYSDSLSIEKMSNKDSTFIHFLDEQTHGDLLFTVQKKCKLLIGANNLSTKLEQLALQRKNTFLEQFRKNGVEKRIVFSKTQNQTPFNGFSFYKIIYKGKLPPYLLQAEREMNGFSKIDRRDNLTKQDSR